MTDTVTGGADGAVARDGNGTTRPTSGGYGWSVVLRLLIGLVVAVIVGMGLSYVLLDKATNWFDYVDGRALEFYISEAYRFRNHYIVYSTIAYTGYGLAFICTTLVTLGLFEKPVAQALAGIATIISAMIVTTGVDKVSTNFEKAHTNMMIKITKVGKNPNEKQLEELQVTYAEAKRQTTFGVNLNSAAQTEAAKE